VTHHTRHAAYPRITFPSFVAVVVGTHPRPTRAFSNCSADGNSSQTATAVTTPNHVHS
jgi:hypothetical protein